MVEFLSIYAKQIMVSALVGLMIGLSVKWNAWLTAGLAFAVSGVLALVITGDWGDFFKDGISVGSFVYLAGYIVISVAYFGPFGCVASLVGRLLKKLRRRFVDPRP